MRRAVKTGIPYVKAIFYLKHFEQFLQRDAMHSAAFAVVLEVSVCPSVRPSCSCIVPKRVNMSSNSLRSGSTTILVFPHQILRREPLNGGSNAGRVYEKLRFSTNISLYLANNTRQGHSYNGTPIGNHTRVRSTEWYHFK